MHFSELNLQAMGTFLGTLIANKFSSGLMQGSGFWELTLDFRILNEGKFLFSI